MALAHNFRPGELSIHYKKHGIEFGPISQKEYLRRARTFLNRATGSLQVGYRGVAWGAYEGDRVCFDLVTQEFGIVSRDGYIRTYYVPSPTAHGYSTNHDYFLSNI